MWAGPHASLTILSWKDFNCFFFSRNILELCISVVFFFLSFDKLSTSFVKAFAFIVHPEVVYDTLMFLPHYCIYSMWHYNNELCICEHVCNPDVYESNLVQIEMKIANNLYHFFCFLYDFQVMSEIVITRYPCFVTMIVIIENWYKPLV